MLEEKSVIMLRKGLHRIFLLKITTSTFREAQNIILQVVENNKSDAEALLQALFEGEAKENLAKGKALELLKATVDQFSVPIRLAKEILEKGEFLNVLTTDTLENQENTLFLNRLRRVDGDEYHFLMDPNSYIHVLKHFTGRLQDFAKTEKGKKAIAPLKGDLSNIKQMLEMLSK